MCIYLVIKEQFGVLNFSSIQFLPVGNCRIQDTHKNESKENLLKNPHIFFLYLILVVNLFLNTKINCKQNL